jgi:hypothetical protein
MIDRPRLNALAQSLNLQFAATITSEEIQFQQLAVGFQIDANGTQIIGKCEGTQPGVILQSMSGPILLEFPRQVPRARLW